MSITSTGRGLLVFPAVVGLPRPERGTCARDNHDNRYGDSRHCSQVHTPQCIERGVDMGIEKCSATVDFSVCGGVS